MLFATPCGPTGRLKIFGIHWIFIDKICFCSIITSSIPRKLRKEHEQQRLEIHWNASRWGRKYFFRWLLLKKNSIKFENIQGLNIDRGGTLKILTVNESSHNRNVIRQFGIPQRCLSIAHLDIRLVLFRQCPIRRSHVRQSSTNCCYKTFLRWRTIS